MIGHPHSFPCSARPPGELSPWSAELQLGISSPVRSRISRIGKMNRMEKGYLPNVMPEGAEWKSTFGRVSQARHIRKLISWKHRSAEVVALQWSAELQLGISSPVRSRMSRIGEMNRMEKGYLPNVMPEGVEQKSTFGRVSLRSTHSEVDFMETPKCGGGRSPMVRRAPARHLFLERGRPRPHHFSS